MVSFQSSVGEMGAFQGVKRPRKGENRWPKISRCQTLRAVSVVLILRVVTTPHLVARHHFRKIHAFQKTSH